MDSNTEYQLNREDILDIFIKLAGHIDHFEAYEDKYDVLSCQGLGGSTFSVGKGYLQLKLHSNAEYPEDDYIMSRTVFDSTYNLGTFARLEYTLAYAISIFEQHTCTKTGTISFQRHQWGDLGHHEMFLGFQDKFKGLSFCLRDDISFVEGNWESYSNWSGMHDIVARMVDSPPCVQIGDHLLYPNIAAPPAPYMQTYVTKRRDIFTLSLVHNTVTGDTFFIDIVNSMSSAISVFKNNVTFLASITPHLPRVRQLIENITGPREAYIGDLTAYCTQ